MQAEYTGPRSTAEGGAGTSMNTPEPHPADLLPLDSHSRSPLLSLQFNPPPSKPPGVDEDEIMDIVPDSEPSRIADEQMLSLNFPGPSSQVPALAEDENEPVPGSSGETDDSRLAQEGTDHDGGMQEVASGTEQADDPMDRDQPLVDRRRKGPPKPMLEEEQEEQQAEREARDDGTVPETEDEVPLANLIKPSKPAPKTLPPRGRSTRNKRPIVYTESPDTSENEVSTVKLSSTLGILKSISGRGSNGSYPR